ncbi:hypothetical protein [uncultured Clostridium sp.]|uniref:hypothetical protein n=1 Tax=uncultured Clostridium sp. TaxID=59620 RepID=UPI0026DAFEB2|nr:hypothetical protein [uncultured Clostridium sp.]
MKIGDKFFERVFINSETGERKVILWTIAAIDEEENDVLAFDGAIYKRFKLSQIIFNGYIKVNA